MIETIRVLLRRFLAWLTGGPRPYDRDDKFIQGLRKLGNDPAALAAIHAAFKPNDSTDPIQLTPEQMADLGACLQAYDPDEPTSDQDSNPSKRHLTHHWGNVEGEGFYGDIMNEVNAKFFKAVELLLADSSRKFDVKWKKNEEIFQIDVSVQDKKVEMVIRTPPPRLRGRPSK